jgi:hypothetical protein
MKITDLCPNPHLFDISVITDPTSKLNTDVLRYMWMIFRTTHPVAQAKFPNFSHLEPYLEAMPATDLEEYRQAYEEIVSQVFIPLLDHDRIMVNFTPNQRGANTFTIIKNENVFTLGDMNFSASYYDKMLTAFNMFDEQTNYRGRKYVVAMFHFDATANLEPLNESDQSEESTISNSAPTS